MRINTEENVQQSPKKMITSRQVVALIGIALLVLMYLSTLITAIAGNPASDRLFFLSLFATLTIPVLIWIYTWMYGKLTGKHTFADFNLGGTDPKEPDASRASDAMQSADRKSDDTADT